MERRVFVEFRAHGGVFCMREVVDSSRYYIIHELPCNVIEADVHARELQNLNFDLRRLVWGPHWNGGPHWDEERGV
jgi:hypothetical protein